MNKTISIHTEDKLFQRKVSHMKIINVVAAVIVSKDKILCTKRLSGEFKGYFEFPGGKIEELETSKTALIREIKEELDLDIKINSLIETVEYDYPHFHLNMDCYFCEIVTGEIKLSCHSEFRWIDQDKLGELNWLPADVELVEHLMDMKIPSSQYLDS